MKYFQIISALLAAGFFLITGGSGVAEEVVIYTALDEPFSAPILREFEKETGITVKPVYDVEATKTVGLVNRLIAEKTNPRCDVFWNNEIVQTIVLKRKGVLQSYYSPSARDIPDQFKDPQGYWTGFAARARVLIYNKEKISEKEMPITILDLSNPRWKGRFTLAYPLFGTTATQAAALFVKLGDENAKTYFQSLKENSVRIVEGNSVSKDRVVAGDVPFGFTDTDDANVAIEQGKPVEIFYPDQNGLGTLLIPNTVCLINDCPHPKAGKKLIDYLLSKKVESKLSRSGSLQIPVRTGVDKPDKVPDMDDILTTKVDFEKVADKVKESSNFLKDLFVR